MWNKYVLWWYAFSMKSILQRHWSHFHHLSCLLSFLIKENTIALCRFPVSNYFTIGNLRKYYCVIPICKKKSCHSFLSNPDFVKIDKSHVIQIPTFSYKYRSMCLKFHPDVRVTAIKPQWPRLMVQTLNSPCAKVIFQIPLQRSIWHNSIVTSEL